MTGAPLVHNPAMWEHLPNARLKSTARDVLDILTARQEPGGEVQITQGELAERLGISQAAVSRAISQLKDIGILEGRTKHGVVRIHPLLAGYESEAHMVNHLTDPDTYLWPLRYESGVRPPRRSDPRSGTSFDPDPDGGEDAPLPEVSPTLRLAG
ncbi:helix-turn-helix transcriptional regulator [Streptomyces hirsutus]|uniref:helix-turn-helix transcriptional regulator n=1 Tax=Streptomyces hirsutus TaxID=35620 RepID=UPI0033297488